MKVNQFFYFMWFAGGIATISPVYAQTLNHVESVFTPKNTVSVDMGTTIMQGDMIPTISVAGATENVAGKVIYGENGDNKYTVGTMGLSGAQWYAQANGASSREEGLTGYSIGGKVGYVTDAGTNLYMHGGHTRVNGVDYGTKTWQTQSSSMNVQTSSQSLGTRTEDDLTNNVRNTIADFRHTTIQTINTTTNTDSVHSGLHGSRTNSIGFGGEINAGNIRPTFELNYDELKFDDNARQKTTTGKVGVVHYTSTGNNYVNVSRTIGDRYNTAIEAGVNYNVNNRTTIGAFVSHDIHGKNTVAWFGVKIALGGSKSAPTPKPIIPTNYGPTTSSDYMVRNIVNNTTLYNNSLNNLASKTKSFENNSTTSSTTTDVKTTHRDESKIIKTENLAPTISYAIIEQSDDQPWVGRNRRFNIKDLLDNGWEVKEIGRAITEDWEERRIDVNTATGIITFFQHAKEVSKPYGTKSVYTLDVTYFNKNENKVKKITYKYSFLWEQK